MLLIVSVGLIAQGEIKPIMDQFFMLTAKVQPYLINKESFMQEKNDKEISQALSDFNRNTQLLKKEQGAKSEDMKFRVKLLAEGLEEAEKAFKTGNKDYSYWTLKASLNNCFSCHTQKSLPSTNFSFLSNATTDKYSKAEFLFIVRNYAEANSIFEDLLVHYPDNKASYENIESSAQKLLFYSIRVSRNDIKTIALFDRILKNSALPTPMRTDILAWKKYLTIRKYRIEDTAKIESNSDLEDFMKQRQKTAEIYKISNQRTIVDLDTSHFLFQRLENNPSEEMKPALLYWLASVEKDYRLSMFDMSAENYLKECIEKYSLAHAAKKCLKLYSQMQIEAYTGTRGTDLPSSVKDQLKKYEIMVNKK
jgi:hypothetical protein